MTNHKSSTLPPMKPYAFHYGRRILEYDPITGRTSVVEVRPLSDKHIVKTEDGSWRFADVSQTTHPKSPLGA